MAASAAVKKKRFDVGGGDAPAATEVVTPAEDSASAVPETAAEPAVEKTAAVVPAAGPEKPAEKTRSLYTVIAEEQKVLREKLTAAISAMKSADGCFDEIDFVTENVDVNSKSVTRDLTVAVILYLS